MELKNLHHIINTHLKENSLAEATFHEDFLQDSVVVDHPKHKDMGNIVITKSMGCWNLEYEKFSGKGVVIEMKIEANSDSREDINEILDFINGHTMHETPQAIAEEQKN